MCSEGVDNPVFACMFLMICVSNGGRGKHTHYWHAHTMSTILHDFCVLYTYFLLLRLIPRMSIQCLYWRCKDLQWRARVKVFFLNLFSAFTIDVESTSRQGPKLKVLQCSLDYFSTSATDVQRTSSISKFKFLLRPNLTQQNSRFVITKKFSE